jgi:hypothetical protein
MENAFIRVMKALFWSSFPAIFLLAFSPTQSMAGVPKLVSAIENIDSALERAEIAKVLPRLAQLVEIAESDLIKVLQKQKFSSVALARFVAEKTKISPIKLLEENPEPVWPQILENYKLQIADAEEFLEKTHTEVAFIMLDYKGKRKKIR